jgi:hypothetical protein
MNVEILNQNNSKHLLTSCFNSNSSALLCRKAVEYAKSKSCKGCSLKGQALYCCICAKSCI